MTRWMVALAKKALRETLAEQRHPHHGDGGVSALIALVPAGAGQGLVHRLAGDHPEGTWNPGRELDVLDAAGGLGADMVVVARLAADHRAQARDAGEPARFGA